MPPPYLYNLTLRQRLDRGWAQTREAVWLPQHADEFVCGLEEYSEFTRFESLAWLFLSTGLFRPSVPIYVIFPASQRRTESFPCTCRVISFPGHCLISAWLPFHPGAEARRAVGFPLLLPTKLLPFLTTLWKWVFSSAPKPVNPLQQQSSWFLV